MAVEPDDTLKARDPTQLNPVTEKRSFDREVIAIWIALIASITSLVTTALTLTYSARKDYDIQRQQLVCAHEEEVGKGVRLAVSDFARDVSTGAIRISWMAWTAETMSDRHAIDRELDAYNGEMRQLLPKLIGSSAVLAMQDENTYRVLAAIPTKLRETDVQLTTAVQSFLASAPPGDLGYVRAAHTTALALIADLPSMVSSAAHLHKSACPAQ